MRALNIDEIDERNQEILLINRKHGNIFISTLRKTYDNFAPHCADNEKLGNVLHKLDVASLSDLVRDHNSGKLEQICRG